MATAYISGPERKLNSVRLRQMGRGVQGWVEFWPMKIRSAALSNPNSLIATFEEYVCLVINLVVC